MNTAKPILFRVALSVMIWLAPAAVNAQDSKSELEKEKSYQMIREYVDYAKKHDDVRIPVIQHFKDYLKMKRDKETNALIFKGAEGIVPQIDLDVAWALNNMYLVELERLYLMQPGAAELEKDARAKHISRENYSAKKRDYLSEIVKTNPDAVDLMKKHQAAYALAAWNSLEIILEDHIRQDIPIPTDWIPDTMQKKLLKSKRVKDIQKKIDALN